MVVSIGGSSTGGAGSSSSGGSLVSGGAGGGGGVDGTADITEVERSIKARMQRRDGIMK